MSLGCDAVLAESDAEVILSLWSGIPHLKGKPDPKVGQDP